MPRAKIPYHELREVVRAKYPFPAFKGMDIVTNHVINTPKVVYMRKDGQYQPYGWKLSVTGFRFNGFDDNLFPQYVYHREVIVIAREKNSFF